jgi:hypothetical protein
LFEKADALDLNGFPRFASEIRDLAKRYEQDAKREAIKTPFED